MNERKLGLQWVSPFARDERRGGWAGMSYGLRQSLAAGGVDIRDAAPLKAVHDPFAKWASRCLTLLMGRRLVWSASRRALRGAAGEYTRRDSGGDGVLFFGAADYLAVYPRHPFACFLDSAFVPFLESYAGGRRYLQAELDRLAAAEQRWLRACGRVMTTSRFAADEIVRRYGVDPARVVAVGTGPTGSVPDRPRDADAAPRPNVLFVSTDFERKGGWLAVEAAARARKSVADLELHIVGPVPADVDATDGLVLHGWIDQSSAEGRRRFEDILRASRLFLILSRVDLTPAAICEASAAGVPTMAFGVGGIPEMVRHGRTGWILSPATGVEGIAEALVSAVTDAGCTGMGRKARRLYETDWNWQVVSERVMRALQEMIGDA